MELTDIKIVHELTLKSILKILRKSILRCDDQKLFLARFGVALGNARQQLLVLMCDWLRIHVLITFPVRVEYSLKFAGQIKTNVFMIGVLSGKYGKRDLDRSCSPLVGLYISLRE